MNAFAAIVFASLLSALGYQMARARVLPAFAAISARFPINRRHRRRLHVTGVFLKLPSGRALRRARAQAMMVLGCSLFAVPAFLYPSSTIPGRCSPCRFCPRLRDRDILAVAAALSRSLARLDARAPRLDSPRQRHRRTAGPLIGGFRALFSAPAMR